MASNMPLCVAVGASVHRHIDDIIFAVVMERESIRCPLSLAVDARCAVIDQ